MTIKMCRTCHSKTRQQNPFKNRFQGDLRVTEADLTWQMSGHPSRPPSADVNSRLDKHLVNKSDMRLGWDCFHSNPANNSPVLEQQR